ncbi:MAG: signal peptide peptidase SppA [Myxococcaceae bacterium]|nr:signal peptide peptidase SppA [Myxococcaceae bacterium]
MRRLIAALVLAPTLVFAQTSTLELDDVSRGLTLPPTSAALADEAFAPVVNPAGLSQITGLQLFYAHERAIARGEVGDGLYLGDAFGPIGLGLNVEWVRSPSRIDRRRTTWGLSLGSDVLALGAGFGFFSSGEDAFVDDASTIDLGLMARPAQFLSLGAVVRNLNEPRQSGGAQVMPRSYAGAIGLRPFGERFTLGVEYQYFEHTENPNRFSYAVQGEPLRGLVLSAGLSHGLEPSRDLGVQLGLTLNLPNFGVTVAGGSAGGDPDTVVMARLSSAAYTSFGGGGNDVVMMDLTALLSTGGNATLALVGASETDAYLRLMRLLAQAEQDDSVGGVVVKIENLPEVGLGRADELRKALLRLRAKGKKVLAVLLSAGDAEYLVASGADRIYALPQSMLLINGVAAHLTFLGGTMEKLDVHWDVARVGAYKNAPDELTRTEASPEQRETVNAWLDVDIAHLENTIAKMRNIPVEQVRAAIAEGLLLPGRAQELGLLDGIIQPTGLDEVLRKELPSGRYRGEYAFLRNEHRAWGHPRRIAIVPVVGTIAAGKSRQDPLGLAEIAGAETVVRALKQAESDDEVAAIVLRVDSGGGDGLASDLMYRAVLDAKKNKPVFASMGDVAASGGYYAAMGAQRIYASPTTLTGSIGVFFMKPALGGLFAKLGVNQETLKRGELSTLISTSTPWTDAERAAAQRWVDAFYDDFITEVAASRKLEKTKVDAIARGRVWAGATAKDLGLVDELGTLQDAVDGARRAAGIPDGEPYDLVILGEESGLLSTVATGLARAGAPATSPLDAAAREALGQLGVAPTVLFQPGLRAVLPFGVSVE